MRIMESGKRVNMKLFKRFAAERLPADSELGQVLLGMKDEVLAEDFISVVPVLLTLSKIEKKETEAR